MINKFYIVTNTECNLKCKHCSIYQIEEDLKLDPKTFYSLKNYIQTSSFDELNFTGGEPLLYSDLLNLLKFSKTQFSQKLSISTNGLLLTNRNFKILSEFIDKIYISIEMNKEFHNILRGKNTYNKLLKNIRKLHLHKSKIHCVANMINSYNLSKTDINIQKTIFQQLGFHEIQLINVRQIGSTENWNTLYNPFNVVLANLDCKNCQKKNLTSLYPDNHLYRCDYDFFKKYLNR